MNIKHYKSLKRYNTFGIDAMAEEFVVIENENDLSAYFAEKKPVNPLILGGGSNILLTEPTITRPILKNEIKGISIEKETNNTTIIKVGGGEVWHELVEWAIVRNLGGIENLSLIPGTVGAAPIQNIGAYGVELKDVFVKLEAINLTTLKKKVFSKATCQFGYRESVFKKALKGQYFITQVYLKLHKNPKINASYGDIGKFLTEKGIEKPNIKDISEAVIAIRQSKLPNPAEIGNAGSFFKNPIIPTFQYQALKVEFPDLVAYPQGIEDTKIAAGWLIENSGWKGVKIGSAGVHTRQALVLVNYDNATGKEILQIAKEIQSIILKIYGIPLEMEVNII